MFEEFNHFFQEARIAELKKKNELDERNIKSGEMAIMKKIARDFIKKNGGVHFPTLNYERYRKYPDRRDGNSEYCSKYPEKDYNMTYNYVDQQIKKFTQDEVIYSVKQLRSAKKNLFDLLGVGHPDEKVLIIHKPSSLGISFNIVRTRQHKLFKKSNNIRFIHFSPQESITELAPTMRSRAFGLNDHVYIYPTSRCYFWAIDIDKIPEKALSYAFETYGRNIYEYNPKPSDRIVIDESDSTRFPGATPVFIEADKSLTVKPVTDEFHNLKRAFEKGDIKYRDPYIISSSGNKRTDDDRVKNICDTLENDFKYKQKQYSRMKETADGKVDKLKMLFDRIKGYIGEIPMMADSSRSEAKDKYPEAKNLDIFDKVTKVYLKKAKELLKELGNLLKKQGVVVEYVFDDDDTSGTSDFSSTETSEPDDCYSESSVVFDKGLQIKVDVSELPFDTVYHGSIKNISMFDDKRTVFVTPSIAMASIFAGRPDIYKLREIRQRYHVKSPDINLHYLEWSDPKTLVMKQPLKTVHVIMQGAPEIADHYKYRQAGYIYAFNIKDPAIRDHVYKSTAMGPNEYVIKGIAPVPIEKIPIEIDVDVTGAELPERFKQEETLPTSGDFAQYAQYGDLDSARGPIMNIHMRPATEADTENMYNWEIESIHPDLQTKPNVQELIRKDVQESIKDTQMIMDGDKTIGMFTACMIDGGEWRYIGEIYLIPEYRGKGIGTSILKNEIENFDKIRLQVATSNTKAIKLYRSLGFKIIKEVDGQMYIMEYDVTKETVQEAKLPAKKRNKLDDSDFALVYVDEYGDKVRKYPVHDEAHVRAAARMFPRGVPLKYKKQVANKILRRAHEYDIDTSGWNSVNHAAGKD